MIVLTAAEELEYRDVRKRVLEETLGRYKTMQVAAPVKSKKPDPKPLPVKPKPSSKEPRYGKRDELLGKIKKLRQEGVDRKQIAAQLKISLSFMGKILTEAALKGDRGKDCEKCGKPTKRKATAKMCRACDPVCRRKPAAAESETEEAA